MERTVCERWLMYKFVESVRSHKEPVSDNDEFYYHCLDELTKAGLYDCTTGTLVPFTLPLQQDDKLEWVSTVTELMMETIGDGSDKECLSNVYLENDGGSNDSEWTMVGQAYEDLAFVYMALKRFLEGK